TFWQRAENFRKQPWRMANSFGVGTLLLFALRRLDLEAAFARISKIVGVQIVAIPMPWAEAAVDVDTLEDFDLVHQILAERPPADRL
ncbi:MAG: MobA-like NTP transferase domain containing protein, partial [Myxococcota bacterium]